MKHQVRFLPEGRAVKVPQGTLVLDAAAEAGLLIDLPCGGQGRCGRCRVRIEQGQVTHGDNPHLTAQQIAEGWVLSCTARVAGGLVVLVPPRQERQQMETTATRAAPTVHLLWPRYPAIRTVSLELAAPTLEDNAADLERLQASLKKELGVESIAIPLPLLRELPSQLRAWGWRATAVVETGAEPRLIDLLPERKRLLGAAVDIGTTNTVLYLADLQSGRLIDSVSTLNRQVACGEDVISRIIYSLRNDGLQHLQSLIIETINYLLEDVTQRHGLAVSEICDMVVAGNTVMTHLFLGLPPRHIREEPYVPAAVRFPKVLASELGMSINHQASVYCLPAVAAYVGGDVVGGVLSSEIYKADKLTLFLDVGTNGEMVLGNKEWLTTDACSAGPAFEGAGIRCGMRAIPGAIEDVTISSRTLEPSIRVIGDARPVGICGSGLISALAELTITGVIGRGGRFALDDVQERAADASRVQVGEHGPEYVLVRAQESGTGEAITLSEVDINNLIRAKGAIYAGIMVMIQSVGVALDDLQEVLIGGAFGQHINVEKAIQIGLLPDLPWERFKFLGNTSALGAYNVLLSQHARAKAEAVARSMTYMELIADNRFMEEFTAALFLPHTRLEHFPSVKALLETRS